MRVLRVCKKGCKGGKLCNNRSTRCNWNRLRSRGNIQRRHTQVITVLLNFRVLRLVFPLSQEKPSLRKALIVAHGTAYKLLFRDGNAPEHGAQLLEKGDEIRMNFCENVLIADNLGEISRAHLAQSPRLTVWIQRTAGEEGRNRGVLATTNPATALVLFLLATLFVFLKLFGRIHETRRNATKGSPDDRTRAECSSGVFARQSHQGVTATLAARHGVWQTKDVGNGITGDRVTKTERTRGKTARQEFAAERANRGSS